MITIDEFSPMIRLTRTHLIPRPVRAVLKNRQLQLVADARLVSIPTGVALIG